MDYTESELIIPALLRLKKYPEGLTTSQLIKFLREDLKPKGHDAEIINGRSDDFFSQKVRNLTGSHHNIERKGLVTVHNAGYKITKKGLKYIEEPEKIIETLETQGLDLKDISEGAKTDYSTIIIEEGALENRSIQQKNALNH